MTDKTKKTITLISGYYYPEDTAIGLYNTQMVDFLIKRDYQVNVITGFPSYPHWEIREDYKRKGSYLKETHNKAFLYRYKQYQRNKPDDCRRRRNC